MNDSCARLKVANIVATALLVFAAPLGITIGATIEAFDLLYPAWYMDWGARCQLVAMAIAVWLAFRRRPQNGLATACGAFFIFLMPLPLYIMLTEADNGRQATAALASSGLLAYFQCIATCTVLPAGIFCEPDQTSREVAPIL
ncbi:FtsH-binding integral membrane protein [Duganella sp. SG902]|uniref:hypothetical protein n=1 Tax=Duganella sp. SG902 TaxID=2587016 RepID=UPI00159EB7D4|nr:hypothetical protein [Duganella sp. SG902]NVM77450.1 FtsH-binding integral membrane protein [Duganella sp. SG902]